MQQFRNSIGSTKSIYKLLTKILACLEKLGGFNFDKEAIAGARLTIKECKAWLNSADQFLSSLRREYNEYSDVTTPIIYAITQV